MLSRLVGNGSLVGRLKDGLDESSRNVKGVAHRVANASTFETALQDVEGGEGPVDLEAEMVTLAEERIRYDAAAQLLQKVYQQIRLGIRE